MKYESPELIDKLAAEYVLGTLHGKARLRFERLALHNIHFQEKIQYWETTLLPLHDLENEVTPSKTVWNNVLQRISTSHVQKTSFWRAAGTWKAISFAMSLVIVLTLVNVNLLKSTDIKNQFLPMAKYVTVLTTENAQAAWIVRMYSNPGKVTIQTLRSTQPGLQKVFELWMLPNADGAPQSVGLMPISGEIELDLSHPLLKTLLNTRTLAVSLEPTGGSPTGAPTGPVLYTGKLNSI